MIKKIDVSDLEIVNELIKKLDSNEFISVDMLKHPFFNCIVYVINNTIVGVLKYSIIYNRIEIDYLYVLEEYRENKIATKLIQHVIDLSEDYENISLEVRLSNIVARKLYESLGFKEVCVRKKYYGNEDALMYMRGE